MHGDRAFILIPPSTTNVELFLVTDARRTYHGVDSNLESRLPSSAAGGRPLAEVTLLQTCHGEGGREGGRVQLL